MATDLIGHAALATGPTSSIGRATAPTLAACDAPVVVPWPGAATADASTSTCGSVDARTEETAAAHL